MPLVIKTREDWHAKMPGYIPLLPTPVSVVICTYTAKDYLRGKTSPGPRPSQIQIIEELLYLQRGDFQKYPDIRFNFMIGPDGCAYEGRSWVTVPTLPLKYTKYTFKSLFIGFIGEYIDEAPPEYMFTARDELLKYGVQKNFIKKEFLLFNLSPPEKYKLPVSSYIKF